MPENQRATTPEAEREVKRRPLLIDLAVRLVKEKPLGTVGGVIVLLLFITGAFADFLAPYGSNEIVLSERLSPPSGAHLLGTDNLGRDLFSRIIYGARVSVFVGLGATFFNVVVGAIIGIISGWFGGKTDMIIQRFVDAWMCFPALFLYLTVMSILGPGLWQVTLVMGIRGGINCRTERSAVMAVKQNVYLEAARSIGVSNWGIMTRHILPNIMPVIIIVASLGIGRYILQEATLSFLGFGIPPPTPSWGGMLSGAGRQYMLLAPWMALWPGLALAAVVYGFNMLGDGVRDLLDPRLRGGLGRYGGVEKQRAKRQQRLG
ncbi:ABC transporter permease [Chloroflexota bacterium]